MFGIYRYILSLMVVSTHLWQPADGWNHLGAYAVYSFFLLSGFLMTLVLNETYADNLKKYFTNRALRIYPAYIFSAAIAFIFICVLPDLNQVLSKALSTPGNPYSWFKNLTLFELRMSEPSRLIPQAWSLYIEVVFYVLMAFLVVRKRTAVYVWFAVSILYTAYLFLSDADWLTRYMSFPAASLPFSAGAFLYFVKGRISFSRLSLILFSSLIALNLFAWFFFGNPTGLGFYIHIILSFFVVWGLLGFRSGRVDSFLGKLSYPVFLIHFQGAVLTAYLFDLKALDSTLFLYSLPAINALALLIYLSVDLWVDLLRARIKS